MTINLFKARLPGYNSKQQCSPRGDTGPHITQNHINTEPRITQTQTRLTDLGHMCVSPQEDLRPTHAHGARATRLILEIAKVPCEISSESLM